MTNANAEIPVRHPDTIPGLAPDFRRVLREEYDVIMSRMSKHQHAQGRKVDVEVDPYGPNGARIEQRRETTREKDARIGNVGAAIAEYRRVAALWGVDVG